MHLHMYRSGNRTVQDIEAASTAKVALRTSVLTTTSRCSDKLTHPTGGGFASTCREVSGNTPYPILFIFSLVLHRYGCRLRAFAARRLGGNISIAEVRMMTEFHPVDREHQLHEIQRVLPDPTRQETQMDGSLTFVGGDPGEVIVRVSESQVSVSVFSIRWDGPHTPVVCPKQLGKLNWKRLPASRLMMVLHDLIESAQEIRRAEYRKCERCGKTKPPEWMHDATTCQACAERDFGVVY